MVELIIKHIQNFHPQYFNPIEDFTSGGTHEEFLDEILKALRKSNNIVIYLCPDNPTDSLVLTPTDDNFFDYFNDAEEDELWLPSRQRVRFSLDY